MECPRAYITLVVLTLLQLCRAGHIHPRWSSARLNDGFDQRSNSENYLSSPSYSTSEPSYSSQPSYPTSKSSYPTSKSSYATSSQSFSSSQPIVVTHPSRKRNKNNHGYTSTLPPSTVYLTNPHSSSTPVPSSHRKPQRHVKIESTPQNIPYPFVQTFTPSDQPLLDSEPRLQLVSEIPHRNNLHQHIEPPYPSSLPVQNLFQTQTTETLEPIIVTQLADVTNPSNGKYVLVYQSSSQSANDFSQTPFRETSPGIYSTVPVTRTSEFSTTGPSSFSTVSPFSTASSYSTAPTFSTTSPFSTAPPFSTASSFSTSSPFSTASPFSTVAPFSTASSYSTATPSTTIISSTTPFLVSTTPSPISSTTRVTVNPSSTLGVTSLPCRDNLRLIPTLRPQTIFTNSTANSLRIRVRAPTGSITNVHINSQKENIKPTTTKKPKTKRTSKPKKNSYDRCLDGCRKVKDQICAAPLGHYSVSAKDLKSFPSVCHMACYNSFKKNAYERAASGNCDKLRRKIGRNSNFILREDLKLPYSVVAKGSDTVIELSKDVLETK